MSTLTAPTSPTASPARRSTHTDARLGFGRLVRAQWIAVSSLRGNLVALVLGIIATAGLAAAFTVLIAISSGSSDGATMMPPLFVPAMTTHIVAAIVAVVVAVSLYSKERSTGAHRTMLAAAPRRVGHVGSKAVVIGASSFVAGLITMALSTAAVAIVYAAFGSPLGIESFAGDIIAPIIGASFYIAACAVFALGIAVLVRSETWAILIVLLYLLMLPSVLMMLPFEWAPVVSEYLLSTSNTMLVGPFTGISADWISDAALTIAWPAAALGVGMIVERSRDA